VRLLIVVEDSGPGVPPEDAAHVFESGWSTKHVDGHADGPAGGTEGGSQRTGRGLGLALVGQVARRYGGAAGVDGSDLGGARFTVTIGDDAQEDPR
jgi:signal transduction histidine kinase